MALTLDFPLVCIRMFLRVGCGMMFCHRFELAFCDKKIYGMLNEIIVKRTNKQVIYAQHVFEQVRDLCWDKFKGTVQQDGSSWN